jgi:aminoglycoside 2''-phosphotransferase
LVGYGLIRGEPLDRALYDDLPGATQDSVVGDLAAFINAIHAFPVTEAVDCGVAPDGDKAGYVEDFRRAHQDVIPLLHWEVRRDIKSQLGAFLEDEANFAFAPALLHADLWPEHVLFARDTGRVTGVIDFGDVSIGDPDYDLAFLAHRLGPGFMERLLRHYPHRDSRRLAEKLRSFSLFNAIDDVFTGLDRGDRALVDSALLDLKELRQIVI